MRLSGSGGVRPLEGGRCRRWQVWQFVYGEDGRRGQCTEVVRGGKRDALRRLEGLRAELAEEVPNSETFGAYAARWCAWRASCGDFSVGTVNGDRQHMNQWCRVLGGERMDAVDTRAVRDAMERLRHGGGAKGRELSGTYMADLYQSLNSMFRWAVANGDVARNPLDGVDRPKVDTREKAWMEPAELEAVVQALCAMMPDARALACILMCECGLRRGEALGLHDADVDLRGGVIHVRHAVKERDGSIGETKTRAGLRTLPLSSLASGAIAGWRAERESAGLGAATTLCCASNGMVLRPQNLYRWWMANRDGLGAGGYTLHQLRHSNLSKMARLFGNPFDLKDWAGWSSLEPARIYIHRDMDALREAVRRAEEGRSA